MNSSVSFQITATRPQHHLDSVQFILTESPRTTNYQENSPESFFSRISYEQHMISNREPNTLRNIAGH